MQDNAVCFTQDLYSEHLAIINEISFTRREIDVIACLLNARRTSQIASILSIAPRTVTTHFRNIMLRLGCNSQEGIITFIERSGKLRYLREYYRSLMIEREFKRSLQEISRRRRENHPFCLIIYIKGQTQRSVLTRYLEANLSEAGVSVKVHTQPLDQAMEVTGDENYRLFLIEREENAEIPQELSTFDAIDVIKQESYYFAFFEILQRILPNLNLQTTIGNFRRYFESIFEDFSHISSQDSLVNNNLEGAPNRIRKEALWHKEILEEGSQPLMGKELRYTKLVSSNRELSIAKKSTFLQKLRSFSLSNKKSHILLIFTLGMSGVGFFLFKEKQKDFQIQNINQEDKESSFIQSDLNIPRDEILLKRPELLDQINAAFKSQNGIQAVALVGPGGAGKTTIARQYAKQQKNNVVWEINAETPESLRMSFENLMQALAKSQEDKKFLREIEAIKDITKREESKVQFIKEHLKTHSHWLLLYDNVERFTDIQKHFPQDHNTWGKGKIILTTRDINIQNNKHVNNIIQIGELSSDQKLNLFIKIMHQGYSHFLTPIQIKEIKLFLEAIPPFPLDISIAVYYLKATNVPYVTYLDNITQNSTDFIRVQENLLKEAGDYSKTRYGIITLSLQHIIETHKDFRDLLLFISLLDSQAIPKSLLYKYKRNDVVESFVYNLKKYSLVTNEISYSSHVMPTFSIHRSTQAIILAYLTRALSLEKNKQPVETIAKALAYYLTEIIESENFPKIEPLINHCEKFLFHDNLLTHSIKGIIRGKLGSIYYYIGDYIKAKEIIRQSLLSLNYCNNIDPAEIAWDLIHLGIVYRELGNCKNAKDLLEHGLVIYKEHAPNNNTKIARTLRYLGIVYKSLGNYDKSRDFLEESVVIYKKQLPKNHISVAWSLGLLGSVYKELGNYAKAKDLLEQSLVIYRKHFLEGHIDIAWVLVHLGNVHKKLGNYETAKKLLEKSLRVFKNELSENHVRIAWNLGYLGDVYKELGDYEMAKKLLEQCLVIYRKHFSAGHSRIVKSLRYLGSIYNELGEYKKAKNLIETSLIAYEKHYGTDHIENARAFISLGQSYFLQDHIETAENYFDRALEIFKRKNHSDIYMVYENLAQLNFRKAFFEKEKGNFKEYEIIKNKAITHLKQAAEVIKTHFPEESPHLARIQANINSIELK